MNERNFVEPTPETPAVEAAAQASAGMLLRAAREAAGIHVATLAVSMKVPVKKLEALEADRLDLLPDAVFVRALASSVCRNLKIDPSPVLSRLPQQNVPRLSTNEYGINAPFRSVTGSRPISLPAGLKQPAVVVVLLLLLAALAVLLFPYWQSILVSEEVAVTPDAVLTEPSAQLVNTGVVSPPLPLANPVVQESVSAPALAAPIALSSGTVAVPAAAPPVTKSASAAVAVASGQQVVFRVSGPSWVDVTDAKNTVLMRRNLAAGEVASASGVLPLSVVVGRADVTEVEVKGKPFSLSAISKDNVARFEVK